MIPKQDPTTCRHHVDFDVLTCDHVQAGPLIGGGRKVRLAAECSLCRSLVTLDQMLTMVASNLAGITSAIARLEATVYGPWLVAPAEPEAEPAEEV
jgi:hypothetical protein